MWRFSQQTEHTVLYYFQPRSLVHKSLLKYQHSLVIIPEERNSSLNSSSKSALAFTSEDEEYNTIFLEYLSSHSVMEAMGVPHSTASLEENTAFDEGVPQDQEDQRTQSTKRPPTPTKRNSKAINPFSMANPAYKKAFDDAYARAKALNERRRAERAAREQGEQQEQKQAQSNNTTSTTAPTQAERDVSPPNFDLSENLPLDDVKMAEADNNNAGADSESSEQSAPAPAPAITPIIQSSKRNPKANPGAVNANLRALDRSGKPCHKWECKDFQIKSFTGVTWSLPTWRPKETAVDAKKDVKSDSCTLGVHEDGNGRTSRPRSALHLSVLSSFGDGDGDDDLMNQEDN